MQLIGISLPVLERAEDALMEGATDLSDKIAALATMAVTTEAQLAGAIARCKELTADMQALSTSLMEHQRGLINGYGFRNGVEVAEAALAQGAKGEAAHSARA